ncbi:hypothetical protein AB0D87_45145 [Streptomyces sp. NPDC048342]|uniref:hypothetical protein n=1 Tax=Streptomyces sp. NPDC048342 TaxID=3154716 RepID=UPI00343BF743
MIGHGFQLVVRRRPDLDDAQRSALAAIGCALLVLEDPSDPAYAEDLDGVYTGFLDTHGIDGYLMRPDWYVFGVAAHDRIPNLVSESAALLHLAGTARPSVASI